VTALIIVKDLAKVASYCFINKIIPKSFEKFMAVVLYGKGKKDYSFLNSYKLITLKNMLVKVLEKYIANIISKVVKEYRLFF